MEPSIHVDLKRCFGFPEIVTSNVFVLEQIVIHQVMTTLPFLASDVAQEGDYEDSDTDMEVVFK